MNDKDEPRADEVAHDRQGCPAAGITPGRWKFFGRDKREKHYKVRGTIPGQKWQIANCPFVDDGYPGAVAEAEANARAIAAVPELLEALSQIVARIDRFGSISNCIADEEFFLAPARAALQKARSKPGNNPLVP